MVRLTVSGSPSSKQPSKQVSRLYCTSNGTRTMQRHSDLVDSTSRRVSGYIKIYGLVSRLSVSLALSLGTRVTQSHQSHGTNRFPSDQMPGSRDRYMLVNRASAFSNIQPMDILDMG